MTTFPLIVREFSAAGPCIGRGLLIRSTAKFHIYADKHTKEERRKARHCTHITPCCSCSDHPNTYYPNGYQD